MNEELIDVTKKSSLVFLGKMFGISILFLFNFIVVRYIGVEIYGKFTYIFSYISFLPVLITLGLDQALVFYIPKLINNNSGKELNSMITFAICIPLILAMVSISILMIYSKVISKFLLKNIEYDIYIKLLIPIVILMVLSNIINGVFRGLGNIKYNVISDNFISPILKVVIILVLVLMRYKSNSLIITHYIATFFSTLYLGIKFLRIKIIGKINIKYSENYKKLLKFSFPILITGILGYIVQRTDVIMIGYFLSSDKVGVYNIALQIGSISSFILIAFSSIFASTISSLYNSGSMEKLSQIYKIITKWIVTINLMAFAIILIFSKDIMHLFGKDFIYGSTALILISIGQVVNAATGLVGLMNTMTGHPQYEIYIAIVVMVISLLGNYFLIPIYGINGAAVTSLLSVAVSNILRLAFLYRDSKLHPYNFEYIKTIASFFISLIIVYLLKNIFIVNWLIRLFVLSFVYVILFLFITIIMGLSDYDKLILSKVFGKLRKL